MLLKEDYRMDFYFTGWVCTHPGEIIFVPTLDDVYNYAYDQELNCASSPTTATD
jgi:hypothetical protein